MKTVHAFGLSTHKSIEILYTNVCVSML